MTNTENARKSLIVSNPMTRLAYDYGRRAAEKHLYQDDAYFSWLDRHRDADGDEEDAWLAGFSDFGGLR